MNERLKMLNDGKYSSGYLIDLMNNENKARIIRYYNESLHLVEGTKLVVPYHVQLAGSEDFVSFSIYYYWYLFADGHVMLISEFFADWFEEVVGHEDFY